MTDPARRPTAVILTFQRATHTQNTVMVALLNDDEVAQVGDLLSDEGFADGQHVFGRTGPLEGIDAVRAQVAETIRQARRNGLAPNGRAARAG
ncbi:MAG TPA: hypothetical protein VKR24_14125 [Candidatus Limnocylindrales bacterium]|nr:hypothetical protein [Candidatus Limnocylindrales bacterium]